MLELGQTAMLERALLWSRIAAVLFLFLGVLSTLLVGYFAEKLNLMQKRNITALEVKAEELAKRPDPAHIIVIPPVPVERHISIQQYEQILKAMAPYAGARINVVVVQEWEPGNYAHQLIKCLRTAGADVKVSYFDSAQQVEPAVIGYVRRDDPAPGEAIVLALRAAGVAIEAKRGLPRAGAVLEIHVGPPAQSLAAAPDSAASSDAVK